MRACGIDFEEVVIPLRQADTAEKIKAYAPAGKVPILIDGDVVVWESLAILYYLAERFPDHPIWPTDNAARAHAFAIASEMHAGFQALRQACPMNLIKKIAPQTFDDDVNQNVERIEDLWQTARSRFGAKSETGEPFLFGAFSAADAMFAPVAARLETYQIKVSSQTRQYMDALFSFKAYQDWRADALNERWDISDYEVDHVVLEDYRKAVQSHQEN